MALVISGIFLAALVVVQNMNSALAVKEEEFCYRRTECGPPTWGGMCQSGTNQSPIDIPVKPRNLWRATETNLDLSECYFQFKNFEVENDGHGADVTLDGNQNSDCFVRGGLLRDTYNLGELHFHWGADDKGSEHSINGRKYAMEAHLVHYKAKYSNVSEAQDSGDSTAVTVLATMFEQRGNDNPALTPIIRALSSVRTAGTKTRGSDIFLSSFLPLSQRRNVPVYQYQGSLTTPPCAETVLWNIFGPPTFISESQLMALRSIQDKNGEDLKENSRPIQPLNRRTISYFFSSVRREQ